LPKCGETVFGKSFQKNAGGKGANQCIAASRLGAKVTLIAKVLYNFSSTATFIEVSTVVFFNTSFLKKIYQNSILFFSVGR